MKNHPGLWCVTMFVAGVAVTLLALTMAQGVAASPRLPASIGTAEAGTDSHPSGTPAVVIPPAYRAPLASAATLTGSVATVYFTPQDENTSTTVLFLYNTSPATATVGLQTFALNGSLTINTSVAVPPLGLVRICGDAVSTISPAWQNVAYVNFTTSSAYARMTLPAGVKVDGYVAWDLTGTYDPTAAVQTLPLRFSSDPASVFLPAVQ